MGRYIPPDLEGTTTPNKLARKHPLGARASKLASQGILIVRFEMPFPIWCSTCPKPTIIGQGVRFNAEKKKVGNYYSSPIYSFRMKHGDCGGWIEIHTDPKNTAYVVIEGAKKRDTGEDKVREGDLVIQTDQERDELRSNAFSKLEKTIEDRQHLEVAKARIAELEEESTRKWEDPYELNRRLRKEFRVGRKQREKDAETTEGLRDKMSLAIDLLPANEEDIRRARLVDFGIDGYGGDRDKALSKPLFSSAESKPEPSMNNVRKSQLAPKPGSKNLLKSERAAAQSRESLASEIRSNTRHLQDPFLLDTHTEERKVSARIPGVKHKRDEEEPEELTSSTAQVRAAPAPLAGLVDYDSD